MHGNRVSKPRYMCWAATETRAHPRGIVSTWRVDTAVFDWLTSYGSRIGEAVDRLPAATQGGDVDQLAARILDLDRRLSALTVHLASGLVPELAYRSARDEIQAQRVAIVDELQRRHDRDLLVSAVPRRAAFDLVAEWSTLPVGSRRAALRELVSFVTVTVAPVLRVVVTVA